MIFESNCAVKLTKKEEAVNKAITTLYDLKLIRDRGSELPSMLYVNIDVTFEPMLRDLVRDIALGKNITEQKFTDADYEDKIKLINDICYQCDIIAIQHKERIKQKASFTTKYWKSIVSYSAVISTIVIITASLLSQS